MDINTEEPITLIDPARVGRFLNTEALGDDVRNAVLKFEIGSVVVGGDWDKNGAVSVTDMDVYQSLEAHFLRSTPWEKTPLYKRIENSISQGQPLFGCKNAKDLSLRFNKAIPELYRSMLEDGFLSQKALKDENLSKYLRSKYLADEVRVSIDRDGRFIALDGRHRLSIAKLLGLSSIPVRIVVRHSEWMNFRSELEEYARGQATQKIYQKIDHPDLLYLPANRDDDRIPILKSSLKGYNTNGKTLVDIGTHWGAVAQSFSRDGFKCIALETSPTAFQFASKITRALECDVECVNIDVFDYNGIHEADVVIALNIFHHFLKTKRKHEKLTALLKQMANIDIMLFQAHVSNPPGQMRDAYLNYTEAEFVAYLKSHTGLQNHRSLGRARDGREMFIIWRDGVM